MNLVRIATWSEVPDGVPTAAMAENVDLVIVRRADEHSVLHGRCLHRGALLADGHIVGDDLICGLHGWDYRIESGVSAYNNAEALAKFASVVEDDGLFVDLDDVIRWKLMHPQPFSPDVYQGLYTDPHGTIEEPYVMRIHELAAHGLDKVGHHGFVAAMGVPRQAIPCWDTIQFVTAQLARLPLLDDVPVGTEVCIGPNARQPLFLDIPLFVSDMSFGALSQEAKTALSRGAQLAGTGICSGEGGMLPEEQAENSRYFYELASARFGWSWDVLKKVQAFHFKLGQGAKTGTGGHLPGPKVVGRIAEVRNLMEGTPAVSPPTFPDWHGIDDFRRFADEVRERSNGIPIGAKLSAQHIEADIDAALEIGVDYIILDGRGGGTGAAPLLFRDNISVPTIPALAALGTISISAVAMTSRWSSPAVCATRPTSPRPSRSAPTRSRSRTVRSRRSVVSACARATPTTARWGSPRRSRIYARGFRSTKPPIVSNVSCTRRSGSWRYWRGRVDTIICESSASTI